jgi:hypothetical protein
LKIFVFSTFFGNKRIIILVNGGKRENRLDVCSTFERMELNRDNVGSLKSQRSFTNPLQFGNTISY